MSNLEAAILLKECQGEKSFSGMLGSFFKPSARTVYRGELLFLLQSDKLVPHNCKDGKPLHNYRIADDSSTTLFCPGDDVAPMSDYEYHIMVAVKSREARYKVFQDDKLDWGSKLKEGTLVNVTLPSISRYTSFDECAVSVIRYIGPLPNENGVLFGVEIQEEQYKHHGSSNGFFDGKEYFKCEENCALFTSLDQLSPLEPTQQTPDPVIGGSFINLQGQHQAITQSPSNAQLSGLDQHGQRDVSPKQSHPRFRINDRVVVYGRQGVGIHGAVKWTEEVIYAGDKFIAVGIETDVAVQSNDFVGSLIELNQRFKCANSRHGKIVMRESEVISERVDALQRREQRIKTFIQGSGSIDSHMLGHAHAQFKGNKKTNQQMAKQSEAVNTAGIDREQQTLQFKKVSLSWPDRSYEQESDEDIGRDPMKVQKWNTTATEHTSLSPVDPKTRLLTRNIAEMMDLAENYEKSMEELDLKVQQLNDEIMRLNDELQQASIKVDQQTSDIIDKVRENSILEKELEIKQQEIIELEEEYKSKIRDCQMEHEQNLQDQLQHSEACLSQRLKEQQDQHQQVETQLQQELLEVRQQCTQFQQQLHEVVDEKEELQAHLQRQIREQQDQHQQIKIQLQQELQEVRQQCIQYQEQLHEVADEKEQVQAHLQQQLREQQDQHQQLQQDLREARQQVTQLQQQLREAADERHQFQARVETAVAFIRGDPLTSQVGFGAIELWEIPREDVDISSKILGTGGWGYVAEGTFHGQKVAVKCLHRGILSQFTTNHVRREISIMAQVRHPNLVLFIGAVLKVDTGPLIITELLNRTLRSAYEDHALEERCKLPILRDVACALNYLHTHCRPIIHRDVSSSNVLLLSLCDGNWLAKLTDFGSANLIRTATTPAEGAVIYSAPEVTTEQRGPQTTKVDVYSFGVLVCEVTLCQLPPDPKDFPAYLDTLERDGDNHICQLAKNCTKRNPEERLTMQDVLVQIDEYLQ